MLVLSRRSGETVLIGTDVCVTVLGVKGNQVRIGITAPKDVRVDREEVADRIAKEKATLNAALQAPRPQFVKGAHVR